MCGGTRYLNKRSSVEIRSPDYPGHYRSVSRVPCPVSRVTCPRCCRSNVDCVWSVTGPPGHYLTFTFLAMDLPRYADCAATDYVQLQEDNVTAPVLGTYCGAAPLPAVDSFGNHVRVVFHSDGNQQDKTGFVIRVNASIEGK